MAEDSPKNAKEIRIVKKFLLFPKRLYHVQNVNMKITRWLKKVWVKQVAQPHFSCHGNSIYLDYFTWEDNRFLD